MSQQELQVIEQQEEPIVQPHVELQIVPPTPAFNDKNSFEHVQRVAKMLCTSDLVPASYKNNIQNTMVALEMANRVNASPLQVMQNLDIIKGKPSWSSKFIIAAINTTKRFGTLKYDTKGEGDTLECTAWAIENATGEKLEGVKITMAMAKAEGWLSKDGSKWKTMPELMIRYRAAAFWGRLYVPEIMMGMLTTEEIEDTVANQELLETNKKQVSANAAQQYTKP